MLRPRPWRRDQESVMSPKFMYMSGQVEGILSSGLWKGKFTLSYKEWNLSYHGKWKRIWGFQAVNLKLSGIREPFSYGFLFLQNVYLFL